MSEGREAEAFRRSERLNGISEHRESEWKREERLWRMAPWRADERRSWLSLLYGYGNYNYRGQEEDGCTGVCASDLEMRCIFPNHKFGLSYS
jgi:hypothetical protein